MAMWFELGTSNRDIFCSHSSVCPHTVYSQTTPGRA